MTSIFLDRLSKRFGVQPALADITLEFPKGSFTALLGPSGCGKTTLLRLVAGFEAPSEGEVRFDDRLMASPRRQVPPEARGIGVVFQSYALWPHMNAAQNVAYPLRVRGIGAAAIEVRLREVLSLVGLAGFETRAVDELSGGQRQRVALARCLIADTNVILFDEPLANLDVHLRASMLEALRDIHRRVRATIVYVTHDQAEALALATRIAVIDAGRLQQLGTPQQIYAAPANAMVAGFVGRGSLITARLSGEAMEIGGHRFAARGRLPASGGATVLLRPEALSVAPLGIPVTVRDISYAGPSYQVIATIDGSEERMSLDLPAPPAAGDRLNIAVADAWIVPED